MNDVYSDACDVKMLFSSSDIHEQTAAGSSLTTTDSQQTRLPFHSSLHAGILSLFFYLALLHSTRHKQKMRTAYNYVNNLTHTRHFMHQDFSNAIYALWSIDRSLACWHAVASTVYMSTRGHTGKTLNLAACTPLGQSTLRYITKLWRCC